MARMSLSSPNDGQLGPGAWRDGGYVTLVTNNNNVTRPTPVTQNALAAAWQQRAAMREMKTHACICTISSRDSHNLRRPL